MGNLDQYHPENKKYCRKLEKNCLFLPLLLSAINRVKRILFLLTCSHNYARVTNLLLISTLHSVMRYLIVSSFPSLTAIPSGVSPSLVTAPIVVRVVEVYVIIRVVRINYYY